MHLSFLYVEFSYCENIRDKVDLGYIQKLKEPQKYHD